MDNNKLREIRNKSLKKTENTNFLGKIKETNEKSQKKTSPFPIQINVINPVSTMDKKDSSTPKKSTFTPIVFKDINKYKTNSESKLSENLQPISDEYKYIQESTNNKITGVI